MFSFYGNSRVVTNSWVTELHEHAFVYFVERYKREMYARRKCVERMLSHRMLLLVVVVVAVVVVVVVMMMMMMMMMMTLCSSLVVIWKSYYKTLNQHSAQFYIDY